MVDTLNPQAGFNPNFLPDGDQFESVYYVRNSGFNGMPIQLNFVDTDANGVPAFPPGDDIFLPGFTIGRIVIDVDPQMPVGTRFGLKEVSAPEPATIALFGLSGLIAVSVSRNKKKV